MVRFYHPADLDDALRLLQEKDLIPLGGGTDLMVRYENWSGLTPDFPGDVISLSHLKELDYMTEDRDSLIIGSGVILNRIIQSPLIPDLLRQALSEIAAPAVRNLATLAGNIQNASPAADSLPPLILMDASVRLISREGDRIVPLREFITGPGQTVRKKSELIESIRIPLAFTGVESAGRGFYRKVGTRKANALSKLSFCGWARTEDGILKEVRISAGAVAPVVVRLPDAESRLNGTPLGSLKARWAEVRPAYEQSIRPIDDQRSTAVYRKRTALKLLDHMMEELASRG